MMVDKRKKYTTASGKKITGEQLDALADELSTTQFDVKKIRKRGRPLLGDAPAQAVQVRLDPQLVELLRLRAKQDHTTSSEVLRQALTLYLAS